MILTWITSIIAVLGAVLVLILWLRLREVDELRKLKRHRSKEEGLADLLQYSSVVANGVIANKNGSLMAAWVYKGQDNASSTKDERELVPYRINQVMSRLGSGWMFHVDAVKTPAAAYPDPGLSFFPDPVTRAMDEERRRLFEHLGVLYEGQFVLVATYMPPSKSEKKFIEMMFDDETDDRDNQDKTQYLINHFEREIRSIEAGLMAAFKMTRLKGEASTTENGKKITYDHFLSWLQFCITGIDQPVLLPNNPIYLDALIGGQEMWGGIIPKIGSKYVQVVSIEGFPTDSAPGILTQLGEMNIEYRWSTRFIFMDQHEALAAYEKFRKKWKQKIRGIFDQVWNTNTGAVDEDALNMTDDAAKAKAETSSGLVAQGYYTSVVVIMDEDRKQAEQSAITAMKLINRLGFTARIETLNTMDAFFGSLPGHGVENVRRPLMNTMNTADLLPTSSIWTGREECPCPFYPANSPALLKGITAGYSPININLHVGDVGHTAIFGPNGSGKSTLLGTLAAQYRRYKDMKIFAFDKGKSMMPLTLATGGSHFAVAADDSSTGFAPLQFLETAGDRAWAMEYIENILILNDVKVTTERRNKIGEAIFNMYEEGEKTLTHFKNAVQDAEIRSALEQYTISGNMGYLLDAKEDSLALAKFSTFEIEDLMNLGQKYAMPVLLYLFRRIERSLDGSPTVIILDEAWLMLGHPAFKEKIREWLKTMRKANGLVILATQNIVDAQKSGILDVIISETSTKIFLPNPAARGEQNAVFYRMFGLNDEQIRIISRATPKKDYYIYSEEGCRLFNLALQKLQLAFVGVSDKAAIREIQTLYDTYGKDWVGHYLETKGLSLSYYLPKNESFESELEHA